MTGNSPSVGAAVLFCSLLLTCAAARATQPEPDIARFITAKSNQVYLASQDEAGAVPPQVWQMFAAASAGEWTATSNLLDVIETNYHAKSSRRLASDVWFRVQETGGFCELLSADKLKFVRLFADEIFKVVPPGSVYFGGTDLGRFAVTALSRSQEEGNPFFILTQNQLVDADYLAYVQGLYRQKIKLPDDAQINDAFDEYLDDATRRFAHDRQFPDEPKQVAPGEDVRTVNGRVQARGEVAVMAINGLLARDIFQDNPDRDFYIEESFPLDWMYPYLEPAGPIFKLRRAPQKALFEETVRNDREYWQRMTRRLIGEDVHDGTSVAEVCAAAQALAGAPKDFQGDPAFLRDDSARRAFSKLRSSGSGLYEWRAARASTSSERRRMEREAELACKQAYLLWPRNPDAVLRYVSLLISQRRAADARKFIAAAQKLNPDDATIRILGRYAR